MRVVFFGNSYTSCNEVPALVRAMAASAEPATDVDPHAVTRGGASLRYHLNREATRAQLNDGPWDAVILQEQSMRPVKNRQRMIENVRDFAAIVRPSGARLVLYMTWARRTTPETQAIIAESYQLAADAAAAELAPAGLAWARWLAERPDVALHVEDDSHPTLAGSYLAAGVLTRTLTGADLSAPTTWAPDELDPPTAIALRATAMSVP